MPKFDLSKTPIPRPEHPRPEFFRKDWKNLNGLWQFEKDVAASGFARKFEEREDFEQEIIVPFVPETELSGINYQDFMKAVWYRKKLDIPADWKKSGRVLLHFEAVDYKTTVWVNKKKAGEHLGGYTPFVLDITALLEDGDNYVVVGAYDDTPNNMQPSGKQCNEYFNYGCMYTRCTGIWQTVWMEHVTDTYITNFKLTPDVDNEKLYVEANLNQYSGGKAFTATASFEGKEVAKVTAKATGKTAKLVLDITNPILWGPGAPNLYDITLEIDGDVVESYFGMRKVEIDGYAIKINGKPVYQRLVLDQAYYPDGIYTAQSDEELKRDIVLAMDAGFNGARMHMKIFEPRYIYHADKLGYLVWGEYPNWGLNETDERALVHMLPEWMEELRRDYNHPSIVGWCPFNETNRDRVAATFEAVYDATRLYDEQRPIIDTSGYVHSKKTDIYDVHDYDQNLDTFAERYQKLEDATDNLDDIYMNCPEREREVFKFDIPYFVSEFGGPWWSIDADTSGWGYGESPKEIEEVYRRYEGWVTALLKNKKMCAFCYTQITDVQQEVNGVYTFDRRVKLDVSRLKKINEQKAAIEEE